MKLKVCSVHDNASLTFNRPYFVQATGIAIRSFIDEVNRPAEDNILYQHPEDFTLYCIGEWDDETGEFDLQLADKHQVLMRGRDAKKDPAQ